MNIHSMLCATLLLFSLAACSSGSSNGPEAQTGNNTVTTETNSADTPSTTNDQPTTSEPTSENGTEPETTTNEVVTSENGDSNGTNGEIDDATELKGEDEQIVLTDGQEPILIQFESSVKLLVGQSLLALNQSLSTGELLSQQQEACIGAFDPALGQPLLAINCEQPLSVSNVPIYARIASFNNTSECRASVQNNNVTNCQVAQAELTVNTLWTTPPTEPGQPERPQPEAGAFIQYGIEQSRLVVESLPAALAGVFRCEFDLSNAEPTATTAFGNCESQLVRIKQLIDEHLKDVNSLLL